MRGAFVPSRRSLSVALVTVALFAGAPSCTPGEKITVLLPAVDDVTSCGVAVRFQLTGSFDLSTLEATLNFQPLLIEGSGPVYDVFVDPGFPLQATNQLLVKADRTSDGLTMTSGKAFDYTPPQASARVITSTAELVTGPLANGRLGDYLLENGCARFVVQNVDPVGRDFNQVGAFGGNLIDAEIVTDGVRGGNDNFWEVQPAVNIETVVRADSIMVVNDGTDGNPAVVQSCGPDDLLDGINPSSAVADVGAPPLSAAIDDKDYEIDGCTSYILDRGTRTLQLKTLLTSSEAVNVPLFPGDYVSGAGSLEQWTPLAAQTPQVAEGGIGELLANFGIDGLTYFGFDEAEGVDYALVTPHLASMPGQPSSSFTTSGVSYVMFQQPIPFALFGFPSAHTLLAGGTFEFNRWFSVGDGSASNAIEVQIALEGGAAGLLRVCVTSGATGQDPVESARVVAARDATGGTTGPNVLRGHWITGAGGCSQGRLPAGNYLVAAAKEGFPYEGGGSTAVFTLVNVPAGGSVEHAVTLPQTGKLSVSVTDESGSPTPARVGVVGFDPSPEPILSASLLGLLNLTSSVFADVTRDSVPAGFSRTEYAGLNGMLEIDLEPGTYQVAVSRGNEYSLHTEIVTVAAGATVPVNAQVVRVLDTPNFISSDYHVHLIDSPDSRISAHSRILSMAGEGVENIVATDHSVITDLNPIIASLGFGAYVHSTPGEEITTFDTGHYNAYPQGLDPSAAQTRGATDWAGSEPPGQDFPSNGNYILTPAQIEALVLGDPDNASLGTVVQINHIGSHFSPLKIDTSLVPPASVMAAGDPEAFRLDPTVTNFFHPFPALELWNGMTIGHQNEFLLERIGIWMNLLNQGFATTAIADTDTHTYHTLRQGGARSWTPSSTDAPASISDAQIGMAISTGKAVGGQGIFVLARLVADSTGETTGFELGDQLIGFNGPGAGDLRPGVTTTNAEVHLDIDIQAPAWAPYDTIEIYTNSATTVAGSNGGVPVLFGAVPDMTLTLGAGDFTRTTVDKSPPGPTIPGAFRYETQKRVTFAGGTALTEDTWMVVLVKGTNGVSPPMFPVHASGVDLVANPDVTTLADVTAADAGIRALGHTNALYVDMDGTPGFDPPIP